MAIQLAAPLPNAAASPPSHWVPRWGKHISQWIQLQNGGWSGGEGCAEASITRALLEYDATTPARMANPEWANVRRVHDPADSYGAHDLMDYVSMLARNQHLGPSDAATLDAPGPNGLGVEGTLDRFGLAWEQHYVSQEGFDTAWKAAWSAPMSLLWVDGSRLSGAYQSASYFPDSAKGKGNHIMLWLPSPDGTTLGMVNDPLADLPDRSSDTTYSIPMLTGAFYGCWVIPAPESARVPVYTIIADCDLKQAANHLPGTVEQLHAGTQAAFTGERVHEWAKIIAPDRRAGYVLWNNLRIS